MNRFLLWLAWGLAWVLGFAVIWVTFARPIDEISRLEQQLWFWTADMYMTNYYYDLLEWVKNACSAEQINQAEWYAAGMRASLTRKYALMTQWEQLNDTLKLYNRLERAHKKLWVLPESYYCILKYVVLDIQDMLRERHIWIMESTWIIKDFEWFRTWWTIEWYAVKKELLEYYLKEYAWYEEKLWVTFTLPLKNKLSGLSNEWQTIADMSTELMKRAVYKSLYEMYQAWFIENKDLVLLSDKIELTQELSCGSFHGNYSVTETFDHVWNLVDQQPVSVPLSVNVCWNYFLLKELDFHYTKIIVHEMAHHYYYFHENDVSSTFWKNCRVSETSQNNQCSDNDFVSEYAQTNMLEDYAEHFMYWFLDIIPQETVIINKKTKHFENK